MKKNFLKFIAVVMAVSIMVTSLPFMAFSFDFSYNGREKATDSDDVGLYKSSLVELIDRRSADTKQFKLSDGSYYIAQYTTDVHYLDENGVWQDIDNTLSVSGNEITTSNAKIKFAKKTGGNGSLFTLHDGSYKLELSLNGAEKKIEGRITNNTSELGEDATELQKMTTLNKISASVIYENILDSTDLEYVIKGSNIKENIIVKSRSDSYTYSFSLALNNLSASMNEKGEILISDISTNESVYVIPAPVMCDANNVASDDVSMTLTDLGNGKYTLTVTADSTWMNASERAYPVTIDPPIRTSSTSSVLDIDFHMEDSEPYVDSDSIYVGEEWRAYWKLTTLPVLPYSAYITNAEITLNTYDGAGSFDGYVGVYEVLTNWDDTLTWSDVTRTVSPEGKPAENFTDYQEISDSSEYTWNVTPIVKKWYTSANYGLTFAPVSDTDSTGTVHFCSDDYETSAERPCLTIEYRDLKGIEDYWTYSSQSAGFAGSGAVNNATGNLVFSIPTLTTTDALMPITPTIVYNSALAAYAYARNSASEYINTVYDIPYLPTGFKLNLCETLIYKPYTNSNGITEEMYIWEDGDGTEHYFVETETDGVFADEDGLLLTLTENGNNRTIEDSNNNVRTLIPHDYDEMGMDDPTEWCLESIEDKNGNRVILDFDMDGTLIGVSLCPAGHASTIQQLRFSYTSDGMLYAIWNPNSGEGVVLRYSAYYDGPSTVTGTLTYLHNVVRVHGGDEDEDTWYAFYTTNSNSNYYGITVDAVAEYIYNESDELLESVTNKLSRYKLEYTYDSAYRIQGVREYATANNTNTAGQRIGFTYSASSTKIRTSGTNDAYGDSDDLITTYVFDGNGRTNTCYTTDVSGVQLYGASNAQYIGEENDKAKNNIKTSVQTTQQSSNYLLNGGFELPLTSNGEIPYWSKFGNVDLQESVAEHNKNVAVFQLNSSSVFARISQEVYLDKGDYSLSLNLATDNAQGLTIQMSASAEEDLEAEVFVKEFSVNESGAMHDYEFNGLNFSVDPITEGEKEKYNITIVFMGITSTKKDIIIDDIMLSKTTGASSFDMLETGHFETGITTTSVLSNFWTVGNTSSSLLTEDSGNELFGEALKLNSTIGGDNHIKQVVYQATDELKEHWSEGYLESPKLFNVSGWAKAAYPSYSDNATFEIKVEIKYYKGSEYSFTQEEHFTFDKSITDWQYVGGSFVTDPDHGIVDTITVMICYGDNPGSAYFDNISLTCDNGKAAIYSYNDYGLVSFVQSVYASTVYEYNENHKISRIVSSSKSIVDYSYDNKSNLISEKYYNFKGSIKITKENGSVNVIYEGTEKKLYEYTYEYNNYGLLTKTTLKEPDPQDESSAKKIESTIEYNVTSGSYIFGTVSKTTDSLGNESTYFYDENTGRVLAEISPNGTGICYEYDAIGNMTGVFPADITATGMYSKDSSSASVSYSYDTVTKRLSSITTRPSAEKSTVYTFAYDDFGNSSAICVGDRNLASYSYNANNGKLATLTYGNGLSVKYVYDSLDRVSEIKYNIGDESAFITVYSYTYDSLGNVYSVTDHVNNEVTMYDYDSDGKLVYSYKYDSETNVNKHGTNLYYDSDSKIKTAINMFAYTHSSGTSMETYSNHYYYDATTGNLERIDISSSHFSGTITPEYDSLNRVSSRIFEAVVGADREDAFFSEQSYTYVSSNGLESARISQMENEIRMTETSSLISSATYNYTYDANGNITQITDEENDVLYKYTYDDLGQLIREDNRPLGRSYVYTYDKAGNITAKLSYAFTTGALGSLTGSNSFSYTDSTWGDLLTDDGENSEFSLAYDEIGNLIGGSLIGVEDNTLTWQGRQLLRIFDGDCIEYKFKYNVDGVRTYKEVCNVDYEESTWHEYTLDGSRILQETVFSRYYDEGDECFYQEENYTLVFIYDETGAPIGMKYRTPSYGRWEYDCYFFEKNLQGDIVSVYNDSGVKLVTYKYDAWGNFTTTYSNGGASTAARYNPFKYRGYYYDSETGWYYLQTRYYNPKWCRFINADGYVSTGQGLLGYNMFAYCNNSPVSYADPIGEDAIYVCDLKTLSVVGHAFVLFQDKDGKWHYADYGNGKNHVVNTYPLSDKGYTDPYDFLNGEYTHIEEKHKRCLFGLIRIKYSCVVRDYSALYIEGDFTESLELAYQYEETGYGEYCLLTNNCLHYARKLLRSGKCSDPFTQMAIARTGGIVPSLYIGSLTSNIHRRSEHWRTIKTM